MPTTKARLLSTLINNDGDVKLSNLDTVVIQDSADVVAAAPSGMTVYSTLDSLPITNLTSGDQAYVSANNRMYISNGSGWYNIALINLSPTMSLDQSGTIILNADTLSATVTITAQDSDNPDAILSFSVESDGNMLATGVTVSQDSSVFTITSLTEDSGGVAGEFDLTFKVSDNINQASEALSFSLSFSNVVDSSANTVILMKATGNAVDNESVTYLNSSNASTGFTEAGSPLASTFTPYASGGYSTYFPGTADYITFADTDDLEFGSGDFTMEAWVYPEQIDTSFSVIVNKWDSASLKSYIFALTSSAVYFYYSTTGSNQTLLQWSETVPLREWTHLAIVRNGNDLKLYVNGTAHATTNSMSGVTLHNPASTTKIGILGDTNSGTDYFGYMRDLRLIKGTAQYTSDFVAPTEALTAVSGTELLTCHLPYISDGSTNNFSVTQNGNLETKAFGPYNKEPWVADHGGSVYLDGTGDYLQLSDVGLNGLGSADQFTIMCWVYPTQINSNSNPFYSQGNNASLSNFFDFGYHSDGRVQCFLNSGSRFMGGTAGDIKLNQWNHVFISKSSSASNDTKIFVNGNQAAQGTISTALNTPSDGNGYIGSQTYALGNSTRSIEGYIADYSIELGNFQPLSNYRPPTSPTSTGSSSYPLVMNNKSDAKIYNAAGAEFTFDTTLGITTNNSTRKWTSSSSVYFDNTDNGMPIIMQGAGFTNDRYWWQELIEGDFTFEGWFYLNNDNGQNMYLQLGGNGGNWTTSGQQFLLYAASGTFYAQWNTGGSPVSATWTEPDSGAWFHYAFVNDGGTAKQFLNGASVSTNTSFSPDHDYVTGGTWTARLGGYTPASGYAFDGYMQDVRITKGIARYTAAFTAPTAEFEL